MKQFIKKNKGFTLIEILVVIGIIAVLAAAVLIAINPARQFAQARDSQRSTNIEAILNAVGQNIADNKGVFTCGAALPGALADIGTAGVNLEPCLVPTYVSIMPMDPAGGTSVNTKYQIMQDAATKRITISATPEVAASISTTR